MKLGEKILQARQAAGLSQRQLCGEVITRNMLSQIEHGTARPSMDTLRYLAGRLGKPMSFFLDEEGAATSNLEVIRRARQALEERKPAAALEALEDFRGEDEILGRERELLTFLACLGLAEQALAENRQRYAAKLLESAGELPWPGLEELQRKKYRLLARAGDGAAAQMLPSLDEELLLRARDSLIRGDAHRAGALLDAAQAQDGAEWALLRGESWLAQGQWSRAAECLHRAEIAFPERSAAGLESCYRELGDYRRAYEYACKRR